MNQPTDVQAAHTQPDPHQPSGAPPGDAESGSLPTGEAPTDEGQPGGPSPSGLHQGGQHSGGQHSGAESGHSRVKNFPLASSLWFVAGVVLLLAVLATVPSADGLFYQLPRFWPGTAVALMLIGGAAVLVGELRKRRSTARPHPESARPSEAGLTGAESSGAGSPGADPTEADAVAAKDPNGEEIHQPWAHVLIVLAIIAYIAVIEIVGFILATSLLFFAIATIMRAKGLIKVLVISLGVGLVTAYFFGNVLSVPLPRGLGVLTDLSRLIY